MTYTDEQLDRIDAAVAEKVMGWKPEKQLNCNGFRDGEGRYRIVACPIYSQFDNYWSPTRDGNAMLEVLAAMGEKEFRYFVLNDRMENGLIRAGFRKPMMSVPRFHDAETWTLAVALAALKSVGAEVQG